MSSLPPPPDDLPEPAGDPVPGLDHPTGAIAGSWPEPPVDAPSPFAPPGVGAFAPPPQYPPQPPQYPAPPSQFPAPPAGALPPRPANSLPTPPGGWIQPEAYGELPPPPQYPPSGPGAPYGGGYQAYRPGMRTPLSYAGFWARFGASIIDGLLVGIVPAIIYFVGVSASGALTTTSTFDQTTGGYAQANLDLGPILPYLLASFLIQLVLAFFVVIRPIGTTGQSLGCRVTGVRVVDSTTGQPIGLGRAFGRHLAATFLSGWCCNLGYLWMLWDDRKQTWHDKLSSSIVVTA